MMEDICSVQAKPHHGIYGVSRPKAFYFFFIVAIPLRSDPLQLKLLDNFVIYNGYDR